MNNLNVISTPDIQGNIGTCTTQSIQVVETIGVLKSTGQTYTTNSCTGEVVTAPYSSITHLSGLGIAIGILVVYALFKLILSTRQESY